jgi:hypothetical protein
MAVVPRLGAFWSGGDRRGEGDGRLPMLRRCLCRGNGRRKSGKPGRSRATARVEQRGSGADLSEQDRRELADAWRGLAAYREQVNTRRASRAAEMAADLVADLVAVVASQPDMIVEDAVCLRLGTLLGEEEQAPVDDRLGPHDLADALVAAGVAAVEATTGEADAWRAPWRVLTATAGILPYPHSEIAVDAIARLRDTAGGRVLPAAPPGPMMTETVLWTRDRYGSRFAVAAPITTVEQPVRWYLWDVDACGHQAFTVHSGFYPTPDAALSAWQAGVGQIAAADTELAQVDDTWLLAELLPAEEGLLRSGGENVEQFAEYHRSKRLSEAVKQAMRPQGTLPDSGLDAATAAVEFAEWLHGRDADRHELPQDMDELVTETGRLLVHQRHRRGIHNVFSAPGRPVRAAHARLLPRRIRRPTGGFATRVDPLAGRATPPHRSWPIAACPTPKDNRTRRSGWTTSDPTTSLVSPSSPCRTPGTDRCALTE